MREFIHMRSPLSVLSVPLPVCLSVCLSICLSICLSVCLYINLSVCLSFFLSATMLVPDGPPNTLATFAQTSTRLQAAHTQKVFPHTLDLDAVANNSDHQGVPAHPTMWLQATRTKETNTATHTPPARIVLFTIM